MLGHGPLANTALAAEPSSGAGTLTAGAYALTGFSITFRFALLASTGQFNLIGNGNGTFVLTGNTDTLAIGLTASVTTFALAGNNATFTVNGSVGTGTFVFTGNPSGMTASLQAGGGKPDKAPKRKLRPPVWDRPPVVTPGATIEPPPPRPMSYPPASLFTPTPPRLENFKLSSFDELVPPHVHEVAAGLRRAEEESEAMGALRAIGLVGD